MGLSVSSSSSQHPAAPDWEEDRAWGVCSSCCKGFSTSNRRHHCRACGKLFCSKCSSFWRPLPQLGYPDSLPVRVCKLCANANSRQVEIECDLAKSWNQISKVSENELHHFPLETIYSLLEETISNDLKLTGKLLSFSLSQFSLLLSIRYQCYFEEMGRVLPTLVPDESSSTEMKRKALLAEIGSFVHFQTRMSHELHERLSVNIPVGFKKRLFTLKGCMKPQPSYAEVKALAADIQQIQTDVKGFIRKSKYEQVMSEECCRLLCVVERFAKLQHFSACFPWLMEPFGGAECIQQVACILNLEILNELRRLECELELAIFRRDIEYKSSLEHAVHSIEHILNWGKHSVWIKDEISQLCFSKISQVKKIVHTPGFVQIPEDDDDVLTEDSCVSPTDHFEHSPVSDASA